MAADPEAVGKVSSQALLHGARSRTYLLLQAFIAYYYQLFQENRQSLGNLYQEQSMLTFEGQKFQGSQAIVTKLASLQFGQCKVSLSTQDFQPSISGGILVFTTGTIQVRI